MTNVNSNVNPNSRTNPSYAWNKDEVNKKPGSQGSQSVLEERSGLSVDDFLKIMAAEMQNQSPIGGSEGGGSKTDYMTQLAQFTSLEQMTQVVENLNYLNIMSQQQYAFSLIGKEVSLTVPKENGTGPTDMETIKGVVDKVKFKEGFPTITVGGKDYQLGSIMEVGESKNEL
ncbi:flagellar hook capping FlgD N-terminal domain-containing protein [Tissierella creatinophila]|uniref:Flagellar basal body rod modification protein n=1 Tax=Tissierella creatinophila DSM 6911 TaxID=1123403 RepID=A0A1U7M983_TISCR|nr:flagellar hook capping FlgD N-terminal domain-containing protein [Tissierella creatinophila]OLS03769.1 flagellar basal body rod modification protein [Tissierella creatinophila DSM 6911]